MSVYPGTGGKGLVFIVPDPDELTRHHCCQSQSSNDHHMNDFLGEVLGDTATTFTEKACVSHNSHNNHNLNITVLMMIIMMIIIIVIKIVMIILIMIIMIMIMIMIMTMIMIMIMMIQVLLSQSE